MTTVVSVDEWMNEWMNEWVSEWVNHYKVYYEQTQCYNEAWKQSEISYVPDYH